MSITYKLNKDKNGVEIKFTEKPSEKVRAKLKELGFRWSQFNGVWYAKQSEETIAYAKELANEEGEQVTLDLNSPSVEIINKVEKKMSVEDIKAERKAKTEKKVQAIKESNKGKKATDPKPKAEPKKEAAKTEQKAEKSEPKKDNIIVFPTKERPRINKAITDGYHTYEECVEKFNTENEKVFGGGYDRYVIKALLDMCGISQNFRNNVMNPQKTLLGSVEYFEAMAQKGYAYSHNNTRFFNADLEIAFAIDYFNSAEGLDSIVGQAEKEVGI